jgi:hypothetical protein
MLSLIYLAPYLFVIVFDYVMREALSEQTLGMKIANRVGTKSRPTCLEKYITDQMTQGMPKNSSVQ